MHSRGEDAEGGFADTDDGVAEVERPVGVHPCGAERGEAPQDSAADDERLAAISITQPTGERRGKHVDEEHGRGKRAHLLVGGVEFVLDEREFAGENVAIDVVEQVEGDEEDQRGEGGADAGAGCCGERGQVVSLTSLLPACNLVFSCSNSVLFAFRLPWV